MDKIAAEYTLPACQMVLVKPENKTTHGSKEQNEITTGRIDANPNPGWLAFFI